MLLRGPGRAGKTPPGRAPSRIYCRSQILGERMSDSARPGPHLFQAASPTGYLGDRSTRDGGYWCWCRDRDGGGCKSKAEAWTVLDSIQGQDKFLARSMWDRMYRDATQGKLRFGEKHDVSVIQRVPDLLELRLQVNPDHKDLNRRHVLRLYFAEPPNHPRLMLALKFGKKPRGEDSGGRQDRHINDARHRYLDGQQHGFLWGVELQC